MRFGICAPYREVAAWETYPFDYLEENVQRFLGSLATSASPTNPHRSRQRPTSCRSAIGSDSNAVGGRKAPGAIHENHPPTC
jgi:hypothetical protein